MPPSEHIPRPRNAFMIFRSEFWAAEKINPTVEHDHRHISRIIGHCWNRMPQDEKLVWFLKAEEEKVAHLRKYPDYRFTPLSRVKKPVKRNVKRNGENEMRRCRFVADLLLAGKEGDELAAAVNETDPQYELQFRFNSRLETSQVEPTTYLTNTLDPQPFRSPLLPPSSLQECTTSKVAFVPHTEYYPFSRNGDIMSSATQSAIEGNMQASIPSSYLQYSPEPTYDPAPPKTYTSTYAYSSTYTRHYDNTSHSYSSAHTQSPYPRHLTSPEAESSARAFQRDTSNTSIRHFQSTPVYSESTMHAGSSCIRFNNPFDPHTPLSQFNPPPSPVDPLQPDLPVAYRRRY